MKTKVEVKSFCPQCGPGVATDEDGCCRYCGSTATGKAVEALVAERSALKAELDTQLFVLKRVAPVVLRWSRKHRYSFQLKDAARHLEKYVGFSLI